MTKRLYGCIRYLRLILMKLEFFSTDFRKGLKYQVSPKSFKWEPSCSMRTDRQTDMTKLVVPSRNFANAPETLVIISRKICLTFVEGIEPPCTNMSMFI
jgi:hypothetical protein